LFDDEALDTIETEDKFLPTTEWAGGGTGTANGLETEEILDLGDEMSSAFSPRQDDAKRTITIYGSQ
jgi:hypothetical protein